VETNFFSFPFSFSFLFFSFYLFCHWFLFFWEVSVIPLSDTVCNSGGSRSQATKGGGRKSMFVSLLGFNHIGVVDVLFSFVSDDFTAMI
jgi:hypothetical protein